MKKLRLNVDSIQVQTFASAPQPPARGTVHANATEEYNCTADPRCTYNRDCYTDRYDCTDNCTNGWTCYVIGC